MNKKNYYLGLMFFIGYASLSAEIYCVRVLHYYFLQTTHGTSIVISSFLGGIAFSSLLFSRVQKNHNKYLVISLIAFAAYCLIVLKRFELIPFALNHFLDDQSSFSQFIKLSVFWLFLFVPAFFVGGTFPLVLHLYGKGEENLTKSSGVLYFWDTLGGIFGALSAGFWLIPFYGLRATILISGLVVTVLIFAASSHRAIRVITAMVIAGVVYTQFILVKPDSVFGAKRFGEIVFQKESDFGKITVGMYNTGDSVTKTLFVNLRGMCTTDPRHNESERMLGELAGFLMKKPGRVLNIGLGCGMTASSVLAQPNVFRLDIAEINPVVAEAAKKVFQVENKHLLEDPKVNLIIKDGARYIRETKTIYDSIIIDIEEVSVIYSSPLYTKEYFEKIYERLTDDGHLMVWSFLATHQFSKVLLNTLDSVFPYTEVKVIAGQSIYIGSKVPFSIPSEGKAEERWQSAVNNLKLSEVNTMTNPALEKYFDINSNFHLPTDYSEKYIK